MPLYVPINTAASGDNTLVAAVAGRKIVVLNYIVVAAAPVGDERDAWPVVEVLDLLYRGGITSVGMVSAASAAGGVSVMVWSNSRAAVRSIFMVFMNWTVK